jgi:murein DD-endopeptidase MepM/ murein hydrolase activator NlpD
MRRALIVAFVTALVVVPTAGAWTWPVKGPVLQKFVFGDDPYAAGQHRGIDISASAGDPVVAAASGTVTFVGTVPSSGKS